MDIKNFTGGKNPNLLKAATEKVGSKNLFNGISKYTGIASDISGLWAATQGDNKAAKASQTFNNISATTGVIGNEIKKDKQGMAKAVGGYFTGDPNMIAEGAFQVKDNGTNLSDLGYSPKRFARMGLYMKPKQGKGKFSYIKK